MPGSNGGVGEAFLIGESRPVESKTEEKEEKNLLSIAYHGHQILPLSLKYFSFAPVQPVQISIAFSACLWYIPSLHFCSDNFFLKLRSPLHNIIPIN